MKRIRKQENNILERAVIRMICFSIVGYLLLTTLHTLWIIMQPSSQAAMETVGNQITGWGMIFVPAVFGLALLYGKIKHNIKAIKFSLAGVYIYQFFLAASSAIIYKFLMITIVPALGIGFISLVLWIYYRQREHDHDYD